MSTTAAATAVPKQHADLNKKAFDELILRKMYIVPSFEIHNGPAGFFDYGPPGCALKSNVLNRWRQHFVVEENMLEMECTCLTPSSVLETSGHVERFTDFMVRDEKTKECFRADKLLEDAIDALIKANPNMSAEEKAEHKRIQIQADAFNVDELHAMLQKYNVKSPSVQIKKGETPSDLTYPFPFNLMFKTLIGPEGTSVGFLRPETSQGLFVNFRRLLDYNQSKMPFAAAQIGTAFRNEISPRGGLLRVREYCTAEIEHFVHPDEKNEHARFPSVADVELCLFPADNQLGSGEMVTMKVGEAVANGVIANQSIAYFMTRTQQYLESIGVHADKMRFRQHLSTEMAHYAADCWDMEILLSCGWTEAVGHADRSCYDLKQHSERTKVSLEASQRLPEPVIIDKITCEANKKILGPLYKKDQKLVIAAVESLEGDELMAFKEAIETEGSAIVPGTEYNLTAACVSFKNEKKTIVETKFLPSVIEPSFGMGRVITAVMEHAFSQRENDEARCVMAFRPSVAPIKVGIFRLINNADFDPIVEDIRRALANREIVVKVDSSSGTVGRRYARADEVGIPYGVTVDFDTLKDKSVTIRDRDSMDQIRVPIDKVAVVLAELVSEGRYSGNYDVKRPNLFSDLFATYPKLAPQTEEADESSATA